MSITSDLNQENMNSLADLMTSRVHEIRVHADDMEDLVWDVNDYTGCRVAPNSDGEWEPVSDDEFHADLDKFQDQLEHACKRIYQLSQRLYGEIDRLVDARRQEGQAE